MDPNDSDLWFPPEEHPGDLQGYPHLLEVALRYPRERPRLEALTGKTWCDALLGEIPLGEEVLVEALLQDLCTMTHLRDVTEEDALLFKRFRCLLEEELKTLPLERINSVDFSVHVESTLGHELLLLNRSFIVESLQAALAPGGEKVLRAHLRFAEALGHNEAFNSVVRFGTWSAALLSLRTVAPQLPPLETLESLTALARGEISLPALLAYHRDGHQKDALPLNLWELLWTPPYPLTTVRQQALQRAQAA